MLRCGFRWLREVPHSLNVEKFGKFAPTSRAFRTLSSDNGRKRRGCAVCFAGLKGSTLFKCKSVWEFAPNARTFHPSQGPMDVKEGAAGRPGWLRGFSLHVNVEVFRSLPIARVSDGNSSGELDMKERPAV